MSADETRVAHVSSIPPPIRRPRRELLRVPIDDIPRGSLVDLESSVEIEMSGEDEALSMEGDSLLVETSSSIPPTSPLLSGDDSAHEIDVSFSIAPPSISVAPPRPGSTPPGAAVPRVTMSIPPPPPPPTGMSIPPPPPMNLPTARSEEISLAPAQLLELASELDRASDENDHDVEEMDTLDFVEDARATDAPPPRTEDVAAKPKAAPVAAPPAVPPAPPPAPPAGTQPPAVPTLPKKKPDWFESFFNEDYLRTVRQPTSKSIARQGEFIEKLLAVPAGSHILDVGCGLGYLSNELARRGHAVVALDASKTMLTRATEDALDYGVDVRYLQGDMREMSFDIAFDAVLCWGTTFGYFDEETNRRVLVRMRDSLKDGGKLVLDVVNRDFVIRTQPNLVWFEGDGCVCMEETQFNAITSTLEVSRNVMLDEGRQRETSYTVRLYALHELVRELEAIGFRVLSVSGSTATPGVFFGADAPRIVLLAERKSPASKSSPAGTPSSPASPPA